MNITDIIIRSNGWPSRWTLLSGCAGTKNGPSCFPGHISNLLPLTKDPILTLPIAGQPSPPEHSTFPEITRLAVPSKMMLPSFKARCPIAVLHKKQSKQRMRHRKLWDIDAMSKYYMRQSSESGCWRELLQATSQIMYVWMRVSMCSC